MKKRMNNNNNCKIMSNRVYKKIGELKSPKND